MTRRRVMPLSVRWRLLLAFLGISGFAVLAAAAAFWAFVEVDRVVTRITEKRAPAALASLELSRQADIIVVSAAPALLAASSESERAERAERMRTQLQRLEALLATLKGSTAEAEVLGAITPAVAGLGRNLDALDKVVAQRLEVARHKDELLRRLSTTTAAARRIVAPAILLLDASVAAQRHGSPSAAGSATGDAAGYVPLQKALAEVSAISDALGRAAAAPGETDLPLLALPLRRSLDALRALSRDIEPELRDRFFVRVDALGNLIDGPDSIPAVRQSELEIVHQGELLLAENAGLSQNLTTAVDRLVSAAKADFARSGTEARSVQHVSALLLAAVVLLSMVSSFLIVWLYVDRSLVRRLKGLADSMLAIAAGRLRAPLPAPAGDEIGRMAEALGVFRDTAVEVEDQRLRERQVVLDTIDYGVLLLDPAMRVRMWNRAYLRLSGLDDSFLRNKPAFAAVLAAAHAAGLYDVADERWPVYLSERSAAVRDGATAPREERLKDGRVIEHHGVMLPDGGRMLTYFDLTHLRQAEEALRLAKERAESASRAKSDFLALMSHELRTPLNAVIGITEMLKEDAADGGRAELDEPLSRILRASRMLLNLINEILDLAKVEAGKLSLAPERVDLDALVRDVLQTAEPLAGKNRNRLALDCPAPLGEVSADGTRLRQIILNLLSNACKFTDGGTITLSVRRDQGPGAGDRLHLAVLDTGIGMKAEQVGQLFQEFSQPGGQPHAKGGTGLGLAISRRLARLMGGDISVDSTPGRGSAFTVSLPAVPFIANNRWSHCDFERLAARIESRQTEAAE